MNPHWLQVESSQAGFNLNLTKRQGGWEGGWGEGR